GLIVATLGRNPVMNSALTVAAAVGLSTVCSAGLIFSGVLDKDVKNHSLVSENDDAPTSAAPSEEHQKEIEKLRSDIRELTTTVNTLRAGMPSEQRDAVMKLNERVDGLERSASKIGS